MCQMMHSALLHIQRLFAMYQLIGYWDHSDQRNRGLLGGGRHSPFRYLYRCFATFAVVHLWNSAMMIDIR